MSSSDGNNKSSGSSAASSADEDNDALSSSAGSTSTQWPSAPSSPQQDNDLTNLQHILDNALNDPFSTHPNTVAHLKANIETHCKQAAQKIYEADVLLAVTGAGFSADSGLATYDCVANIEAYQSRGWRYRQLCTPLVYTDFSSLDKKEDEGTTKDKASPCNEMETEQSSEVEGADEDHDVSNNDSYENNSLHGSISPQSEDSERYYFDRSVLPDPDNINHPQWFYGFWGQCFNDYRRVGPHDGYDIIKRWSNDKNVAKRANNDADEEESTVVAKQIRSITDKLQREDDDNSCCSGGSEEPYHVSDQRAGAFYLFTSNVDAHSFDIFESHEIRECHGNVELWQCHNFACGTNDSSLQMRDDNDNHEDAKPNRKGWQRRLWRLPDDHQFIVCQDTMTAPYSISATDKAPLSEPSPKRQKSISELDKMDDDDTANAIGAMMSNTVQRHLACGGDEDVVTSSDELPPAHIGDVHGKPRLSPLKHMQYPAQASTPESYYLSITSNWPKCPRCNEAARPAVLMFEDLDWVYNKKQEQRWQSWCQSLLKLCKHRARGGDSDQLSFSSTSTVGNGSDMSENGWEHVFDEGHVNGEEESGADRTSRVPRASPAFAFVGGDDDSLQREEEGGESCKSADQSSHPLKVCILEIGCGYNVPTCRAISEGIVSKLNSLGGDATLVRINPAHPEADDSSVEDNIISIMEKGLTSLNLIDVEYSLLNQDA